MGARPVASLNFLRFGAPEHPRTRSLVSGVVAGIGGYGNSFGVPTVGGSVGFHKRYDGNILVNAMAVGIADADKIFYAKATGVGMPIVYLGSKTGRDGIHGATMASAAFEKDAEEKRPTVQVGDPFAEKLLLEACLELMASGAVIAIQDMGAAGLTSSAVEMGAKGDLGVELDLDAVPCRESGMSAYEMMLSESQERMLMVLKPEKQAEAEAIFRKWGLEFAVIGKTTDSKRFVVKRHGEVKADLPIKEMGDEAPLYDRPWTATPKPAVLDARTIHPPISIGGALLELIGSPDFASKRWVYEQYDTLILGNSVQTPGGDAGVIRLGDGPKGLALTTDCTERYCEADPVEGGKQAVAEAWRNLICVGAKPLALTDNLNFGNPEKAHAMGQLVGCLDGIGQAARALDFPIVSGNVSLYNETMGSGILPTPAIGGVGVVADVAKTATLAFKRAGEDIWLIGGAPSWLGRSAYLSVMQGKEDGAPPPVDLVAEKTQRRVRGGVDRPGPGDGGARSFRRRPRRRGGGDGDQGRPWGGAVRAAVGRAGARLFLRRRPGALCRDGAEVGAGGAAGGGGRKRARRSTLSARPEARRFCCRAKSPLRSPNCKRPMKTGFRAIWALLRRARSAPIRGCAERPRIPDFRARGPIDVHHSQIARRTEFRVAASGARAHLDRSDQMHRRDGGRRADSGVGADQGGDGEDPGRA